MQVTNTATGETVSLKIPILGCFGCLGVGAAVIAGGAALGVMILSWTANAVNALLN